MPKAFWVNQGGTYLDERSAGLLWAPERNRDGAKLIHWESLADVQPGDVVFTYSNSHVRGYAVASSGVVLMSRPYAAGSEYSPSQGGRAVFCTYHDLRMPIPLSVVTTKSDLKAELQSGRNPVLDVRGKVAQKYLCEISQRAAMLLAEVLDFSLDVKRGPEEALAPTTVLRLADARLGQGKFRDDLFSCFEGSCAVTGLAISELLRASHIKPWTVSNNTERLDPANGVLLAAGVDAAFDRGYIGFGNDGSLLLKPLMGRQQCAALGIPSTTFALPSTYLTQARQRYLAFHRVRFGF
jgi:putative restriction endonuclease